MSKKEWTFEDCVERDYHNWNFYTNSCADNDYISIVGFCKSCGASVSCTHHHAVHKKEGVTA